jgi:hypothetical protein
MLSLQIRHRALFLLSLSAREDASIVGAHAASSEPRSPTRTPVSPSLLRSPSVTSPVVFDPSFGRHLFAFSPSFRMGGGVDAAAADADDESGVAAGREELDTWLLTGTAPPTSTVADRIVRQLLVRAQALASVSGSSHSQWSQLVDSLSSRVDVTLLFDLSPHAH